MAGNDRITQRVGVGGVNRSPSVKTVQELLNRVPPAAGGPDPRLAETGLCDAATLQAIRNFQKLQSIRQDGIIDPGGMTLTRLVRVARAGAATPEPKSGPCTDLVIYLAFPDVRIKMPDPIPLWIPFVGHASVLPIKAPVKGKLGLTYYFEYGRYDTKNQPPKGIVCRHGVPDVSYGPDGHPTQESLKKVLDEWHC
jgi:peptidoglycan hydrolase-like protein with peptidoglycan-binding domain